MFSFISLFIGFLCSFGLWPFFSFSMWSSSSHHEDYVAPSLREKRGPFPPFFWLKKEIRFNPWAKRQKGILYILSGGSEGTFTLTVCDSNKWRKLQSHCHSVKRPFRNKIANQAFPHCTVQYSTLHMHSSEMTFLAGCGANWVMNTWVKILPILLLLLLLLLPFYAFLSDMGDQSHCWDVSLS